MRSYRFPVFCCKSKMSNLVQSSGGSTSSPASGGDPPRRTPTFGGFKIPWVKGKTGRFCPYCGRSIRNYYKMYKCPYSGCQRPLSSVHPELPSGYTWCQSCVVGFVKDDWHNCTVCRNPTTFGRQWDRLINQHRQREEALQADLRASIQLLKSGGFKGTPQSTATMDRPPEAPGTSANMDGFTNVSDPDMLSSPVFPSNILNPSQDDVDVNLELDSDEDVRDAEIRDLLAEADTLLNDQPKDVVMEVATVTKDGIDNDDLLDL